MYNLMDEYMQTWGHEGEDCWDDETDDSFEREVEEKAGDMCIQSLDL